MTTIKGNPNIAASSKGAVLPTILAEPDTTQSAYYGKNEQSVETTCFYALL